MNSELLRIIVLGFGVLIAALSLWGAVMPRSLIDTVARLWSRRWSLFLAVVIRLLLGAAIVLVADRSRFPLAFAVLGWFTLAAGVGLAFMGRTRVDRILASVRNWPDPVQRVWCLFGAVFGVFLVYGVA